MICGFVQKDINIKVLMEFFLVVQWWVSVIKILLCGIGCWVLRREGGFVYFIIVRRGMIMKIDDLFKDYSFLNKVLRFILNIQGLLCN